jgi:hypothetical protein
MFDEDERLIYETRMQSLADVESKIASAAEKGEAKGMQKGERKLLLRQLKTEFGELSADLITRIEMANEEEILNWSERILTANTLNDIIKN